MRKKSVLDAPLPRHWNCSTLRYRYVYSTRQLAVSCPSTKNEILLDEEVQTTSRQPLEKSTDGFGDNILGYSVG